MGKQRCFFCGRPSKDLTCRRRKCRRMDYLYQRERRLQWNRERLIAIRSILCQWCRYHNNWDLSRLSRWWHTFKGVLLVAADLLGICKTETGYYGDIYRSYIDAAAIFDQYHTSTPGGSGDNWTELVIGKGIFTNWQYEIRENSSW